MTATGHHHDYQQTNPKRRRTVCRVQDAVTVADLRHLAQARLPNFVFEYLEGGAAEETSLSRNRAVFSSYPFSPKMAVDVRKRDLSTSIFGTRMALPVITAPTGGNGLLWPSGDLMLAEAGNEAGIPVSQSTVSMTDMAVIAGLPSIRHWFQLYPYGEPHVAQRLIERAVAAKSEALIVTVDGSVAGNREWDRRNYKRPGQLSLRSKLDVLMHPGWLYHTILRAGLPNVENLVEFVDQPAPNMFDVSRWVQRNDPHVDWQRLQEIRSLWPRRLIIKGLMRPDDVLRALDIGADAVVLSNHGGRQVEPTVSPMEILPLARKAVGAEFPIIIDSGFRSGAEIVAAIGLGANAVMLGRAFLYGLAAGGKQGAVKSMDIIRSEIDRTLALLGVPAIADLSPDIFFQAIADGS